MAVMTAAPAADHNARGIVVAAGVVIHRRVIQVGVVAVHRAKTAGTAVRKWHMGVAVNRVAMVIVTAHKASGVDRATAGSASAAVGDGGLYGMTGFGVGCGEETCEGHSCNG
jgi:hypothetical protein